MLQKANYSQVLYVGIPIAPSPHRPFVQIQVIEFSIMEPSLDTVVLIMFMAHIIFRGSYNREV